MIFPSRAETRALPFRQGFFGNAVYSDPFTVSSRKPRWTGKRMA